ncbi:MAG: tripartite tricarboxylate transporter permease [Deltaproteobacteria bacterium]|nr:tripartite tricarboxylate transporter permease [Deltaproteobacteria bacterium]
MEVFNNLALGFSTAFSLQNLLFCLFGVVIGTLVGVLPGISPLNTTAMLLPFTFGLAPTSAMIMLAGIFYGAQYGGSTTAILVNVPGETSAVVTCLDGYQMARQGRAGHALAIAAIASFFAGCVATVVIALLSTPLAAFAIKFTAPEYFSLLVMGLIAAVVLAHGSPFKAIAMVLVGILTGLVGIDVNSGVPRLSFGIPDIADGMDFVPVVVGLFGIGEVAANLEIPQDRSILTGKIKNLMPRWADFKAAFPAILRGTSVGTILGILPGGGAALPPFAAYALEKKVSRDPSRFGTGVIQGVASPEAANNAGAQTSFIPLLTMGIPTNPLMALMIGALMIQGIQPGPSMIREQPALYWGVVASMWIGNLMLVVINLPLVGIWVSLLKIPYRLLFPAIILFCCIGAYASTNSVFSVWLMLFWGALGYFFNKVGVHPAPMVLGFVLGPILEENFRRAMLLSGGDPMVFIQRPISATLLVISVVLLVILIFPAIRAKREQALQE